MSRQALAGEWGTVPKTLDPIIKEIKEQIAKGRYEKVAITGEGKLMRINFFVFIDYLTFRDKLNSTDIGVRKSVPPFRPDIITQYSGWANRLVLEPREEGICT